MEIRISDYLNVRDVVLFIRSSPRMLRMATDQFWVRRISVDPFELCKLQYLNNLCHCGVESLNQKCFHCNNELKKCQKHVNKGCYVCQIAFCDNCKSPQSFCCFCSRFLCFRHFEDISLPRCLECSQPHEKVDLLDELPDWNAKQNDFCVKN